jgi:hypothetical protein
VSVAAVGAVYLAREAEGIDALRRFARSYARFPAGMPHDLIVVFKGFENGERLDAARAALGGLPHTEIRLPDVGFDLGAYQETCRRVPHDFLAFFNTHAEMAAPNWLAHLYRYASQSGVGIAGATGSYESIRSTVLLLRNAIWRSIGVGRRYDRWLAYYFDFVLSRYHPGWYGPAGEVREPAAGPPNPIERLAGAAARALRHGWFSRGGTTLIWPGAPRFDYMQFPPFPNAHIRTNAFMTRRSQFLQLELPATPGKFDTSLFESGPAGMTATLRGRGLDAIVVGGDGRGYGVADWWRSGAFRLGDQGNLLVVDNHSRAFASLSPGGRATHEIITWGEYRGALPETFPDLGVRFPIADFSQGRKTP